jgi:hypothetical protein
VFKWLLQKDIFGRKREIQAGAGAPPARLRRLVK